MKKKHKNRTSNTQEITWRINNLRYEIEIKKIY
jgi:hypothetical protein